MLQALLVTPYRDILFLTLPVLGLVALAGVAWKLAVRREDDPSRVRVLLYHRVLPRSDWEQVQPPQEKVYSVPEDRFRDQMRFLSEGGYHPISADALVAHLEEGTPLPDRPVLISFDDGCVSVVEKALPILEEHGFPAILFVTTDPTARIFSEGSHPERRLEDDEIRRLHAGGVTIGSHSVRHLPLEPMDEPEVTAELDDSKRELERILGEPVHYFGVPFGWYGPKVRAAAEASSYKAVFTSTNGTVGADCDLFHIRRFSVEGPYELADFERCMSGGALLQRRMVTTAKRLPARLLGPAVWMPLRRWIYVSPLAALLPTRRLKWLLVGGLGAAAVALTLLVVALI